MTHFSLNQNEIPTIRRREVVDNVRIYYFAVEFGTFSAVPAGRSHAKFGFLGFLSKFLVRTTVTKTLLFLFIINIFN